MRLSGLTNKPEEVNKILENCITEPAVEQPAESSEIINGQANSTSVNEAKKPTVKAAITGSSDNSEKDSSAESAVVDILKELEEDNAQIAPQTHGSDRSKKDASVSKTESEKSGKEKFCGFAHQTSPPNLMNLTKI